MGAEKAVKGEVAQRWPDFRFAYSRPGFLTFKLPEQQYLTPDFNLASVFARAYGFSLGKVSPGDPADRCPGRPGICSATGPFARSTSGSAIGRKPGDHGFEPSITPAAIAVYEALRTACPRPERLAPGNHLQQQAAPGDWIADCVLVEPNEWWVGFHRAGPLRPAGLAGSSASTCPARRQAVPG